MKNRLQRIWRIIDERVSNVVLAFVVLGLIVGAIFWGYYVTSKLDDHSGQINQIQHSQAANTKAAQKALAIIDELPQFKAALVAGQGNLNTHLVWIECRLGPSPNTCGAPPPLTP